MSSQFGSPLSPIHPAPVIYINAYPGIDKLTIARHLLSLLPHLSSHPPLINNHTLIDPVTAPYPRTHPDYQAHRKAARERAFETFVLPEHMRRRTIIFTDWQAPNKPRAVTAEEYRDVARWSGRKLIPIILTIDEEENCRRVVGKERREGGKAKQVNPERLKAIRREFKLLRFGTEEELVLDVTGMRAEEVAGKIARWVWWVGEFGGWDEENEDIALGG
ncbi:hypothetical protein K458DRAFT_300123 [Lentithecium fluviatile CBS 122367]|uniref:P-loop containing nucleoside triphosphate hydrolase protein n=1 Tax=Lentithecium fluviatile CBS 122367 TaxID=1168545 RepID=A0A6G1J5F3_9PLEO|nr:hypothetical protein K458DRAFT_300123 [Lentithecium fluviatile CBS 122367]